MMKRLYQGLMLLPLTIGVAMAQEGGGVEGALTGAADAGRDLAIAVGGAAVAIFGVIVLFRVGKRAFNAGA